MCRSNTKNTLKSVLRAWIISLLPEYMSKIYLLRQNIFWPDNSIIACLKGAVFLFFIRLLYVCILLVLKGFSNEIQRLLSFFDDQSISHFKPDWTHVWPNAFYIRHMYSTMTKLKFEWNTIWFCFILFLEIKLKKIDLFRASFFFAPLE